MIQTKPFDSETLEVVRKLIPYVQPIRDNNEQFPEAMCDVTSSQIYNWARQDLGMLSTLNVVCGGVDGAHHIWVRYNNKVNINVNIDFTAHQFPCLTPCTTVVDGFRVLVGTDGAFSKLGYKFFPKEQCEEAIDEAFFGIAMGEYGECSVTT